MASGDKTLEQSLPSLDPAWAEKHKAPPLKDGKDYHVFLSHSNEDINFTKAICKILEDLEYKVFFADRDSVPGHSIIQEVSNKMKASDRVLMLVTSNFLKSNFFDFESNLALMFGYERKILTLVPVLCDVTHNQVPDALTSGPVYVTLKDPNFWERIFLSLTIDAESLASVPAGDVAHGLAWSYYYGYLKMVLPADPSQNRPEDLGERLEEKFKERATWDPDCELSAVLFKRMIIIVPHSCFCNSSLTSVDSNVFAAKSKENSQPIRVAFRAARAGHPARDYSGTLYLVKDPEFEGDRYYTCQMEFATPVMSMYEMVNQAGTQAGITAQALQAQRILFVDKLRDILGKCPLKSSKNVAIIDFNDSTELLEQDPHKLSREVSQYITKQLAMESELQKAMEETRAKLEKEKI